MLLVGLAVLQGLLVVVLLRVFGQSAAEPAASSEVGAVARPTAASAAPAEASAAPKPEAAAAATTREPAAAVPAASGEPTESGLPGSDGSGNNAPTCEELWAKNPPRAGKYPGAAYAQSREANRWITRGDLDKAQVAFCLAVRWDGDNVSFLVGKGHLLLLRRDGDQAEPVLRRALELEPGNARARELLGDALARTGDYAEAQQSWLIASGYKPTQSEGLKALARRDLRRGEQHLKRREWVHAERMLRRVVVMDPTRIEALIGLSRALTSQDDAKAAAVWARQAVVLDARNAAARIELGDALAKTGDEKGAAVEWHEAQLLDPTDAVARQRLRGE